MKRRSDAADAGLRLEPSAAPSVLRFLEATGQPILGEASDPVDASLRAERCLLEAFDASSKRRRGDEAVSSTHSRGDAEKSNGQDFQAEERGRMFRELQKIAMSSLRNAEVVSELLHNQFLRLHPCYSQTKVLHERERDLGHQVRIKEEALSVWPCRLREIGQLVAGSQRHAELERVLTFLRGHWPIQRTGSGHYSVEVWSDMMGDDFYRESLASMPKRKGPAKLIPDAPSTSDTGRSYSVALHHSGIIGVCLTFPVEFGRFVQGRHRLFVNIQPLDDSQSDIRDADGKDGSEQKMVDSLVSDGLQLPPLDFRQDWNTARAPAIHKALCEAREALVDATLFRRIRDSLSQRGRPSRWHLLRASSNEVFFGVQIAIATNDERILGVKFRYSAGPSLHASTPGENFTSASTAGDRLIGLGSKGESASQAYMWQWLGSMSKLHLRELLFESLERSCSMPLSDTEDLLTNYVRWVTPRLEVVGKFALGTGEAATAKLDSSGRA